MLVLLQVQADPLLVAQKITQLEQLLPPERIQMPEEAPMIPTLQPLTHKPRQP